MKNICAKSVLLAILVMGFALTSCQDSPNSAIEKDEMNESTMAPLQMEANMTSGSNILFEDDFESNSITNYTLGAFGPSGGSATITNSKFDVSGNFVKSFSPNLNVNNSQVASDDGFSVCLDATPVAARAGGSASAVRLSISLGHETQAQAVEGFDGTANNGYLRLRGYTGQAVVGGATVVYDEEPAFGKSYKVTLTVSTDEISAGTPYEATLYIDGNEVGVFSGTWDSENNYLGFHAIDGVWSVDNLLINSSSSSPCLPTATSNVYISNGDVLAYDHILPEVQVDRCYPSGALSLEDTRWTRVEGQTAYNIRPKLDNGIHAFEQWWGGLYSPANFGEAEWINASDIRFSNQINTVSPHHNWSRYEMPVNGNGTFSLKLLADNCSWIYLSDPDGSNPQLVGYQDDAGLGDPNTPITYGVTLNGEAKLTFLIYDTGGDAGGKFRLETTTEDIPEFEPPTPANNAPVADAGTDQTVSASGQTTPVTLSGSGSDADGDDLTYSWTLGGQEVSTSSSFNTDLADGSYTYTLTVSDGEDTDSDDVTVTVVNTVPVADAGAARTIEAEGITTSVTLQGSATDADGDSPLTYAWSDGSTGANPTVGLGIGTHTFTLTVSDPQGASNSDEVTIKIVDTTAPEISLDQVTNTLWPPNHKMVLVASISATDIVDENPAISVDVTSNESSNGRGDGNTDSDYDIVTNSDGSVDVYVRSERSGKGSGRMYSISVTATDEYNNISSDSFEVQVAKSQGRGR